MPSNNIGQIAYLQAQNHGLEHIYFGGSFIRGMPWRPLHSNFFSPNSLQATNKP